jgi:REP element-mobilizing transposase RayT
MKYNPDIHHRKSVRLQNYDYSSAGAYFVTLCTFQRQHLFGEVVDGEMQLNELGLIVQFEWKWTEVVRPTIDMDVYVVMPNHLHGIVVFGEETGVLSTKNVSGGSVGADSCPLQQPQTPLLQSQKFLHRPKRSLGSFVAQFKATTTKRINQVRDTLGTPVWQRNYHEHVIRNDEDCNRIRDYIQYNPQNWATDEENQ